MQTKLFGTAGLSEETKPDLDMLVSLPEPTLERLVSWLIETKRPIPFTWADISDLVAGTDLSPRDANSLLNLLRLVLTNWRTQKLTTESVATELEGLGYPADAVRRVMGVLSKTAELRERVYRAVLKRTWETTALPTLDDINIVWDVRPMFEEPAYTPEPSSDGYASLVSTTYVLLLELSATREDGQSESKTYQLSEDDFDRLSQSLNKARRQLEIIKKSLLL